MFHHFKSSLNFDDFNKKGEWIGFHCSKEVRSHFYKRVRWKDLLSISGTIVCECFQWSLPLLQPQWFNFSFLWRLFELFSIKKYWVIIDLSISISLGLRSYPKKVRGPWMIDDEKMVLKHLRIILMIILRFAIELFRVMNLFSWYCEFSQYEKNGL